MNINIGALKNTFPIHEHNFYEIIICTEGEGYLQTETKKIPVTNGTIIIVPPKNLHCCISENKLERIFINGNFDRILHISKPLVLQNHNDNDGVILAKLIYNNRYNKTEYLPTLLSSFESYILDAIEIDDEMSAKVKSIISEIMEKFSDCNIDLCAILKESGYSEDYIRAQFKIKTGKTPVRFLTEIRIEHSCLLIDMYKKSLSLSEVSETCGFTDYVYFSRRFKEIKGVSPREYMRLQS